MSLEASIAELTAAVRALTDVLLNPAQQQVISTPVESALTEEAVAALLQDAADADYAKLSKAEIVGTEDLNSHNEEPAPELTYDDVKKATIALSAKSKAEAVELLAHFGVKKATELPQDQWHTFVEMATLAASA